LYQGTASAVPIGSPETGALAPDPKLSEPPHLALKIFSFSFHQSELPRDESGHGGGFIFDARGLPNPGREERFKPLTGKDASVADYLDAQTAVHEFLAAAASMVEASVKNYQERGFNSLSVGFGCTGGQHRSVYLAEALARHFQGRQGVNVLLREELGHPVEELLNCPDFGHLFNH
jgi:RNase adaptor protein for sRNA GlmZ degradation